ncbi:MAG: hypothetical protein DRQ49_05140 [Gammaproteobacteria bacterium]|nr:MAG: hypothetical protein DRQ49_05140 [Gammaproteobacteria bacterium]RKZ45085.1 MAG: hypothetical protein DRQ41_01130 [Gammaproteobacteria bacterium]RKZ76275.1 MAG: hypothetical protein DRQ57_04345 [Gammaproteobacteria bacterium]
MNYQTVRMMKPFILICLLILSSYTYSEVNSSISSIKRIAHAGGGYQGETYTNSLEALNDNITKGFEWFEIDFSLTKDGHLVCIHDWKHTFEKLFHFETTEKPSLETFQFLVKQVSPYHVCTLDDLRIWLKKHPKAKLITDVKEDNLGALAMITKHIENFQNRVIPQCYFPENYPKIRQLGYKSIIWTLYRYSGNNQNVIKVIEQWDKLLAVTMPPHRAEAGLGHALLKEGIPSYVHTINTVEELHKYTQEYAITEIYTDFLAPLENTTFLEAEKPLSENPLFLNDCMATYSVDGTLYIPCLSLSDSNQTDVYKVYMQRQSPEFIFKLDLKKIKYNLTK